MLDADGDPVAPTTPDTEISEDNAAATDAAEEVAATSGMDGMGLITFTGAETDCTTLAVAFKAASGPKTTLATLYPRALAVVGSGTLSAGSAGGGTLGTLLAYDVTGCFIKTTGGTGGGGTGGANNQARKIVTYNTGTGAFTVAPDWETTPSTDTTYEVLLPEGVTLGMLRTLNPTVAGRTLDVSGGGEAGVDWANVGSPATTVNLSGTTVKDATDVNTDTDTLLSRLGTPSNLGGGATVAANLADIEAQTDDIGVAGAGLTAVPWNAAWDAEVQSEVDDALIAKGLDHLVFAAVAGADVADDSIVAKLVSKSATADWDSFVNTTDALEALRDRGDAAWVTATSVSVTAGGITASSFAAGAIDNAAFNVTETLNADVVAISGDTAAADNLEKEYDGTGFGDLLVRTTIASLASQTSFTLAAGSADNDAYNGCVIIVEDQSTAAQKAVGVISDYTGSTKTVTLANDPAVFTMAAGDLVTIRADRGLKPTVDNRTLDVDASGGAEITANQAVNVAQWSGAAVAAPNAAGVPRVDLDLIEGADVSTSTAQLGVNAVQWAGAATATDDIALKATLAKGTDITGFNDLSAAQVNAEVDAALADIHLDHWIAAADPGSVVANNSFLAKLTSKSATAAFSDFDNTTESLQALRDRGDAAWVTATSVAVAAGGITTASFAAGAIDNAAFNVTETLNADVVAISGDATAADNAELFFDGTGYAGGTAKLGVDVVAISGDAAAADQAELFFEGALKGFTVGTGSTTTEIRTNLTEADDYWVGSVVVLTSGNDRALARRVTAYANANGALTVAALPQAPAQNDTGLLTGRIE